jgi:geranylgeranyl pyrophosphate synthase
VTSADSSSISAQAVHPEFSIQLSEGACKPAVCAKTSIFSFDASDIDVLEIVARMRTATALTRKGLLDEATSYHLAIDGSAWRVRLELAASAALGVSRTDAVNLGAACELIHQASLVHDDVQDQTAMRHNQPTCAQRFGTATAICVGDHLLASAFGVLAEIGSAKLIRCFAARLGRMIGGQTEEFHPALWRTISPAHYSHIIDAKAGVLAALPIEGAMLLADQPTAITHSAIQAASLLGTAYQINDDIDDLQQDLERGALNGNIVYYLAMAAPEDRTALLTVLERAPHCAEAVAWMPKMNAAAQRCSTLAVNQLHESIALAAATPPLQEILTGVATKLLLRHLPNTPL